MMTLEHALVAAVIALVGAVAELYFRLSRDSVRRDKQFDDARAELSSCRLELYQCQNDRVAIWKHLAENMPVKK